jgi:thiol-disulfide isomerase/thioredoxin
MDPVGIGAVVAVLLAGTAAGVWRNRTNGRLRDVGPAAVGVPVGAVDGGRKMSGAGVSLAPTQDGVGEGGGANGGTSSGTRGGVNSGTAVGAEGGLPIDPAVLADLGVEPGERATLLQFSSAHCAPCRAVRRISSEVAGEVPGVRHIEVDAEDHLDAVRALGIWRTPTLLVLDGQRRIVKRATGVPEKPQLIAAVTETL